MFHDIHLWPEAIKKLVGCFLFILLVGYTTSLFLLNDTSGTRAATIIEHYNGNEANEDAEIMKFKKSQHEILVIMHTHILSLAPIFFILSFLLYHTPLKGSVKKFLMYEPLLALITTFGGIYLIWLGIEWMAYIVLISGFFMHGSFYIISTYLFYQLIQKRQKQ